MELVIKIIAGGNNSSTQHWQWTMANMIIIIIIIIVIWEPNYPSSFIAKESAKTSRRHAKPPLAASYIDPYYDHGAQPEVESVCFFPEGEKN